MGERTYTETRAHLKDALGALATLGDEPADSLVAEAALALIANPADGQAQP